MAVPAGLVAIGLGLRRGSWGEVCRPTSSGARPYESMSPRGRAPPMRERPRGGPPSEHRREYRHIAVPHVFLRALLPLHTNLVPPNAPRAQSTRGALWLRCWGPPCPSGSQTRPRESMSPRGRAHTMRERPHGGLPSEPRREHRHTDNAQCFSSRPSVPTCKHRPPNAPQDQPTRGASRLR